MKIKIWLSTSNQGKIETLTIKPKSPPADEAKMDGYLWFKDEEEYEAKVFFKKLKKFLEKNYKHKERAPWLNDDWVDKE